MASLDERMTKLEELVSNMFFEIRQKTPTVNQRFEMLEQTVYKLQKTIGASEIHDTLIALTRAAEYVELKDTIEKLTLRVYALEEKQRVPIIIDDENDTKVFDMKEWIEKHLAD